MPSLKQRNKKAKLLGLKAARFRELYQEAYGPKAFKPYTHMTILTSGRRSSIANTVQTTVGKARSTTVKS